MDFGVTYTKEQEDFRKEVRAWIEGNVPDNMKAPFGETGEYPPEMDAFWKTKHLELAKKGWLHPTFPKQYGGGGLSADHETVLMEEFRKARVVGHHADNTTLSTLLVWGTEEQKQNFLGPLLRGEKTSHQKLTEPQSGSDQANVQTRAVKDGDDWLITGQNVFISTFKNVTWLSGQAKTDPNAPRHRNTGFFIVENPSPGLEIRSQNLLVGTRQKEVFMDNVRVPGENLIGGPQQGWQVMGTLLEAEHGGRGRAISTDADVEGFVTWVKETKRNGGTVGNDPVVRQATVDTYLDAHVAGLLVKRVYWMYQSHRPMAYESNLGNVYGRHSTIRNATRIRDVMGPYVLVSSGDPRCPDDGRQEINQRSRAGMNHLGGSNNIAKVILARRIGISRTKERAAPTPSTATAEGS